MQLFQCDNCGNPIFFENTFCEGCDSPLGYLSSENTVRALVEKGPGLFMTHDAPETAYRFCENHAFDVCNWLVDAHTGGKCVACGLNGIIPNLDPPENRAAWREIEHAKHRLVYSLLRLGLPVHSKAEYAATGLRFDFLSDGATLDKKPPVITGHNRGVITLNIAEADSPQREMTRKNMKEPYRTLIGHFRHEIGHYYWNRLLETDPEWLEGFRAIFGNERIDYAASLDRYHTGGAPADWPDRFVSAYSASHPWEDWAEVWAHYLHLVDTLETAYAFGVSVAPPAINAPSLRMAATFDPYAETDFDALITVWPPLTFAINSLNRSMGQPDLYPFVVPPSVVDKLRFVHRLIHEKGGLSG